MVRRQFTREFKIEAVRLVRDRGVSVAQASRDLSVHENVIRKWMKDFDADPGQAFPGHGHDEAGAGRDRALEARSPEAQSRARHPKKSRGLLREGPHMMFSFIAKHRGIWPVALICEALGVSRSGFYAWADARPKRPSKARRSAEPEVRKSFLDSDRTYGARRVWRDVLAAGLDCGLHAVERLMQVNALKAQAKTAAAAKRYWRSPGRRNWQPTFSTAQFMRCAAEPASGLPTSPTSGRRKAGFTLPLCSISSRAGSSAGRCGLQMTAELVADALMMALWRRGRPRDLLASFRSRHAVHERAVPELDDGTGRHVQPVALRQRLGQRGDGELLLDAQDRADSEQNLSNTRCRQGRCIRLYREVLQSPPTGIRRSAISAQSTSRRRCD